MKRSLPRDVSVGVGVGAFSGLLGVGGGVLLVPYLTSVRKIPQKIAGATSLVLVTMGAISGCITYAFAGDVAWIPALIIVIGGLVGAWAGAHLVQRIHDHRIKIAFGVLLILVAIRLVIQFGQPAADDAAELPSLGAFVIAVYVASGVAMGLLSALFGIGGGIILVPILVVGFGYGQQLASGTSLAVMAPIALLGAIRLTKPGLTNWPSGLILGSGAVVGAVVGALVAGRVSGESLRVVFAVLLISLGARMVIVGAREARTPKET